MSNIKEQIRQEVERQRSFIEGLFIDGDNSFYEGQDDTYNHLLAFIDSLPDEKKTIKGLTCRDLKKIHKIIEAMLKETKEVYIEGQEVYGAIYPAFRASEKAFYTEVLRRLKEEAK